MLLHGGKMVKKYRYGNPIETDAIIKTMNEEEGSLPYFQVEMKEGICFSKSMSDQCIVYGLGETVRGINKRGWLYESFCSDDACHEEHKHSLYGAHNFLIVQEEENGKKKWFGFFIDYPGKISFDIGYSRLDQISIFAENADLDFYVFDGESILSIIKEFRSIIGMSYIPPKWAFGYGQSRWSYMDEDEIRDVVKQYQNAGMPLDAVYLDIDYMERYKDFTLDEEHFPNFKDFTEEMRAKGIHLVPIIDAGVKIEEGYDTYEEGVKNNYFCKKEDGTDFVGAVWPGRSMFPDFLQKEVRDWFGGKYQFLMNQGIEGFWNDMNEPAIFYSDDNLANVFEKIKSMEGINMPLDTFREFTGLIENISNNDEDYKRFYHRINGEKVRHDKVHNLYGYNMTRAAGETFQKVSKDKRILMFSRSSYVGMHRYGGIWMGDNFSWWSHILLNLKMLPSLNMVGILYTGADLGGFGVDTTEDLMLRWMALGIFTPLMRNHSAMDTRRQELYRFGNQDAFRNMLNIRYGLLPYLYSEFMKAALKGDMMFLPLSFVYTEDPFVEKIEDQLLVGESIMIAPVYTQNADGRYVYLPEEMKMIRMKAIDEYEEEIFPKGHHYMNVALCEVVFFIRPDRIVPICKPESCVEKLDEKHLNQISFVKKHAEYELYQDDGYSTDYELKSHITTLCEDI